MPSLGLNMVFHFCRGFMPKSEREGHGRSNGTQSTVSKWSGSEQGRNHSGTWCLFDNVYVDDGSMTMYKNSCCIF